MYVVDIQNVQSREFHRTINIRTWTTNMVFTSNISIGNKAPIGHQIDGVVSGYEF